MNEVKGYKVFNSDWTCNNFQYEVGKTYKHKGEIGLCCSGFHFCEKLINCFNYYNFDPDNKVAEVIARDTIIQGDNKSVTSNIEIVKEISWSDVLNLVNIGKSNTGKGNSGNCNSGNWNSGNWNSGNCNSGNRNSGNCNSGNWNSGDCNSGMFNSCNYSNGLFNSKSPKIYLFNKPTKLTFEAFKEKYNEAYLLLYCSAFNLTGWISEYQMTGKEKEKHPEYKAQKGYLKRKNYKKCCQEMWDSWSKSERAKIKKLPNFDKDIFKEITGIEV